MGRILTYQQVLIILSQIDEGEHIHQQYVNFTGGYYAVELSNRLPSISRSFLNQCLDEMVQKQLVRYSDVYTGPYRYRITHRGRRYLALFADLQGSDKG